MTDDSAEILLFQPFLLEAIVSSSGMCRDVHSVTLSIQHFLCRPRRRPPSEVPPKDGSGEAVVARDMPEPWESPSHQQLQEEIPVGPTREPPFLRT